MVDVVNEVKKLFVSLNSYIDKCTASDLVKQFTEVLGGWCFVPKFNRSGRGDSPPFFIATLIVQKYCLIVVLHYFLRKMNSNG